MKPPGDPAGGLSRALRLPRVGPLALSFGLTFAPLTAGADPMALWRIVHDAWMPHVETGRRPKTLRERRSRSRRGGGRRDPQGSHRGRANARHSDPTDHRHRRPQTLAPDAPPVFADAWRAKALLEARLGRPLPCEAIGFGARRSLARDDARAEGTGLFRPPARIGRSFRRRAAQSLIPRGGELGRSGGRRRCGLRAEELVRS